MFPNRLKHCPRVKKLKNSNNISLHYSSINQCLYQQWELMGELLMTLVSSGFHSQPDGEVK